MCAPTMTARGHPAATAYSFVPGFMRAGLNGRDVRQPLTPCLRLEYAVNTSLLTLSIRPCTYSEAGGWGWVAGRQCHLHCQGCPLPFFAHARAVAHEGRVQPPGALSWQGEGLRTRIRLSPGRWCSSGGRMGRLQPAYSHNNNSDSTRRALLLPSLTHNARHSLQFVRTKLCATHTTMQHNNIEAPSQAELDLSGETPHQPKVP